MPDSMYTQCMYYNNSVFTVEPLRGTTSPGLNYNVCVYRYSYVVVHCMYVVKHCTYVCIPVHVNTILFKQFTNIQERFLQTNKLWTPGLIRTLDKFSTVCAWIRLDSTFAECHKTGRQKKN